MKPHVHCKLITAWGLGATIEHYDVNDQEWYEAASPLWHPNTQYRVKPVTLEQGQWYPMIYNNRQLVGRVFTDVSGGSLLDVRDMDEYIHASKCTWIGEPLDIDWPEIA